MSQLNLIARFAAYFVATHAFSEKSVGIKSAFFIILTVGCVYSKYSQKKGLNQVLPRQAVYKVFS